MYLYPEHDVSMAHHKEQGGFDRICSAQVENQDLLEAITHLVAAMPLYNSRYVGVPGYQAGGCSLGYAMLRRPNTYQLVDH
jgi:hypothetical protein